MQRTTVVLPEHLHGKAKRKAHELGISFGEFVRRALDSMLAEQDGGRSPFGHWAVYDGPVPNDLAENHDRYLYGDLRDTDKE